MNWEIRFDTNTLPDVKEIASGNLQRRTRDSAWWSAMTEKVGREWRGRSKREGYTSADSCSTSVV